MLGITTPVLPAKFETALVMFAPYAARIAGAGRGSLDSVESRIWAQVQQCCPLAAKGASALLSQPSTRYATHSMSVKQGQAVDCYGLFLRLGTACLSGGEEHKELPAHCSRPRPAGQDS